MTRGCRDGKVTKDELRGRLARLALQDAVVPPSTASLPEILGHAIHHGVVDAKEIAETVPRSERTIACYLLPRLQAMPVGFGGVLDAYVKAASRLFHRGALLSNLLAQSLCGARVPLADGAAPRYTAAGGAADATPMSRLLFVDDVRNGAFKQLFLPERWPTATVPRHQPIDALLATHGATLPRLPDWTAVMAPTGWDNAINRMATKACGNIQVHCCTALRARVERYLDVVTLEATTDRAALKRLVTTIQRPLADVAVSEADYAMALEIRTALGADEDDYPPDNAPWNEASFALHVFLTRHGPEERAYLPVVNRGRKYCYVDAKIARAMLSKLASDARTDTERRAGKKAKKPTQQDAGGDRDGGDGGGDGGDDASSSECVGDILGLSAELFHRQNKALRTAARRRLRRKAKRRGCARRYKERLKRRAAALRCGAMHPHARVDSIETDGVGLRMCVKEPVDIARFVRPLLTAAEAAARKTEAAAKAQAARAAKKRRADATRQRATTAPKKRKSTSTTSAGAEPVDRGQSASTSAAAAAPAVAVAATQLSGAATFVGVDDGRKKLFVASISRHGAVKPQTVVFTRSRYYSEMGYWRHRAWCHGREANDAVRGALVALSQAGGFRNCQPDIWVAALAAQKQHEDALDREYVDNLEYAVWRMRLFRKKRGSLDRAASGLMRQAVQDTPLERPLVVGVGNANFASSSRGEMSAPTSALSLAFKRAMARVRATGRHVVFLSIWEHRTTMCCCACGAVTTPARVVKRDREGVVEVGVDGGLVMRASRRLRVCTQCIPTGKLRDRDVQASRNILWLAQHEYYGAPRPLYMCRQVQGVQ
jgi:hypothetical protein